MWDKLATADNALRDFIARLNGEAQGDPKYTDNLIAAATAMLATHNTDRAALGIGALALATSQDGTYSLVARGADAGTADAVAALSARVSSVESSVSSLGSRMSSVESNVSRLTPPIVAPLAAAPSPAAAPVPAPTTDPVIGG